MANFHFTNSDLILLVIDVVGDRARDDIVPNCNRKLEHG
jgi:hypothetical protein